MIKIVTSEYIRVVAYFSNGSACAGDRRVKRWVTLFPQGRHPYRVQWSCCQQTRRKYVSGVWHADRNLMLSTTEFTDELSKYIADWIAFFLSLNDDLCAFYAIGQDEVRFIHRIQSALA